MPQHRKHTPAARAATAQAPAQLAAQAFFLAAFLTALLALAATAQARTRIPDTGQNQCYGTSGAMACPGQGQAMFGQDAQYLGPQPAYRDNGDGTVTDLVTGLTWSQAVDGQKMSPEDAARAARSLTLGGHSDWRLPNIKELYSLIDFRGTTGSGRSYSSTPTSAIPYINTDYFHFRFGNTGSGERYIDAQWATTSIYTSTTMGGARTMFGVNFADGRIKGYGYQRNGRTDKLFYVRYVRGPAYGRNDFSEGGDGTVTDRETGLTWTQADNGAGVSWQQGLAWCENLRLGGHDDWRLPSAKELQYIVDYSRSPDATNSPAIDPVFRSSAIRNEAGQKDWPFYWTSTSHLDGRRPGDRAAYVAFGRAIGQMHGQVMDVHGAGAQRSDPKQGRAELGHGPQGDAQRVNNFVRCVRGGEATLSPSGGRRAAADAYPNNVRQNPNIVWNGTGSAPLHQTRQGGGMHGQGGMQSQGPPGGFVQHLDRDGDGRVSRSEFDGPPQHFDILDRDHDGYLSESEAPSGPPPGRPPRQ